MSPPSPAWQDNAANVLVNCTFTVAHEPAEEPEKQPESSRFSTWFMIIMLAATVIAAGCAAARLFASTP